MIGSQSRLANQNSQLIPISSIKTASELASKSAGYIIALAKSKMLDDFGEAEGADAILKPYILKGLAAI